MSERRRWAVLGALAVLVALAAALNGVFPAPAAQQNAAVVQGVALRPADTTAWYCPGPLPVGARTSSSSVAVADVAATTLRGEVRVVTARGRVVSTPLDVASHEQVTVPLERTGAADFAAASVLVDGAGAAVEQVVQAPSGATSAPCAPGPATTSWFPAASTAGANDLELGLFDPSATPAVVSVTVATGSGSVAPPALQGMSIAAGQLVLVNVGREVPQQQIAATTVSTTSGEIAAGGLLVFARRGGGTTEALTTGATAAAPSWTFAPAPAGGTAREIFAVLNPAPAPAHVRLRVGPTAAGEQLAMVPPGGVVELAAPAPATMSTSWASVASLRGAPLVVARETVIVPAPSARPVKPAKAATAGGPTSTAVRPAGAGGRAAGGVRAAVPSTTTGRPVARATTTTAAAGAVGARGGAAPSATAPLLATGTAVDLGEPAAAREWVLPGGESNAAVGEVLSLADPAALAATVIVEALRPSPARSLVLRVPAGGVALAPLGGFAAPGGEVAVLVRSSRAVVASSFLYELGAAGGIACVPAISVGVDG